MTTAGRPIATLPRLTWTLAVRWWRQLLALAAAAGIVALTIVGALGVGAGMQRGLRQLAVGRLGGIQACVIAEEPFRAGLAAEIDSVAARVPGLVIEGTLERATGQRVAAVRVTLLACDGAALGFTPIPPTPAADEVLLNEPAARTLGLAPGDSVMLRVPRPSNVPADSPLGRRAPDSAGRRLRVAAVLPATGIGQFALRPVQVTRPLAVVSLRVAQELLGQGDVANTVFLMPPFVASAAASPVVRPGLADLGLSFDQPQAGASWRLSSRRLLMPPAVDRAAAETLGPLGARPSLVFLANRMRPAGTDAVAGIPYSTVVGLDTTDHPAGRLVDEAGAPLPLPAADEVVIDRWMADDLAAQGRPVAVGDPLEITFFAPETLHGRLEETTVALRIRGIAAMQGAAVARDLVPEVAGITDEASIADWDPPFPFDRSRVRTAPPHDEDDRYWKTHGATPKAFVALETARRLAGSRFGGTTAWHVPAAAVSDPRALGERIAAAIEPAAVGIRVVPVRDEALAAARGSTPFGGLFLALSSFVVVAGLILEWLLFRLLVAARRRDIGLLSAVGWPPGRLTRLLLGVGGLAAAAGAVVGAICGPAWATALLAALGRAWDSDVAAGSARVFTAAPPLSAAVPGGLAAFAVSLVALVRAARRTAAVPPLRLLQVGDEAALGSCRGGRFGLVVPAAALVVAGGCAAVAARADAATAIGLFFGAGFAALVGLLGIVRRWLCARPTAAPLGSLAALARRGLAHRPGRAFAVVGIVAIAQFLVVAVSSFTQRPPDDPGDRASPTGGWTELVSFGSPTALDPAAAETRAQSGLTDDEQSAVARCDVALLRSSGGDDAACTNLYAAARPTVLGVGSTFVERGGFRFVTHAGGDAVADNPWRLLAGPAVAAHEPVPAILDQATAQWGLKLGGLGATFTVEDDAGRPVTCRIVGLLEPGILQGAVIVAEQDFERIFAARSGYAQALVDTSQVPAERRAAAIAGLATLWADAGASFTSAVERLHGLQAVQNTFLAGFQALGTLGLLLGTAGVAAVQLQGVAERLGSLSLLRAVGFTLGRIRLLIVLETLSTVGLGLLVGTTAAWIAVAHGAGGATTRLPTEWIAVTCGLTLVAALAAGVAAAGRLSIPERPRRE